MKTLSEKTIPCNNLKINFIKNNEKKIIKINECDLHIFNEINVVNTSNGPVTVNSKKSWKLYLDELLNSEFLINSYDLFLEFTDNINSIRYSGNGIVTDFSTIIGNGELFEKKY